MVRGIRRIYLAGQQHRVRCAERDDGLAHPWCQALQRRGIIARGLAHETRGCEAVASLEPCADASDGHARIQHNVAQLRFQRTGLRTIDHRQQRLTPRTRAHIPQVHATRIALI